MPVSADGVVSLTAPLRGQSFRLELRPGPPHRGASAAIAELRAPGAPEHEALVNGRLPGRCEIEVRAAGRRLRMRPTGARADFEAGLPLRARPCGGAVLLPAGELIVQSPVADWLPYVLRLRSPAPDPQPVPLGGRVLDPGGGGLGERDGVRVEIASPSWLILGESFSEGWRASCDGQSLGSPQVVDAFANGWLARPGCREVRFWFAPGSALKFSYALSALAVVALLALLLWPRMRSETGAGAGALDPEVGLEPAPFPPGRALAVGAAVGLICAFLFALRAGVVIGPALAILLWRGVPARTLALWAGGLLGLAVPLVYVLFLPDDRGGFNSRYSLDLSGAHWVTLAALLLLALALWRTLASWRAGPLSRASSPSGAQAERRVGATAGAGRP